MKALMLALLLHPEVFAKAQEEIDKLTKRDRLVDFDDRDSLPYFECVMKEAVRYVLISRYIFVVCLRYLLPIFRLPDVEPRVGRWACPVPLGKYLAPRQSPST